jgi:hypothetical protein
MSDTSDTNFLGLALDNTFSWMNHVDAIVLKLSSACFAVRAVKPFLSPVLQSELLSHFYPKNLRGFLFHSIMTNGLVFWANSYPSNTVFKLQKRIIRIMVDIRGRESCREYFRKLKILPLQSQYTYSYCLWGLNIYILTLIVCEASIYILTLIVCEVSIYVYTYSYCLWLILNNILK